MALIQCPDCGRDMSSEAPACPNCGRPNLGQTPRKNAMKCPHCGSFQVLAAPAGFSSGNALGGTILFGWLGALFGFSGSDKIKITCLQCHRSWTISPKRTSLLTLFLIIFVIFVLIIFIASIVTYPY